MNKKMLKEAIIIILLLIVIIFAMGVLFYDSITENADVISNADYETSEAVNEVLKQIEENEDENDIKESASNSLLKSYSIDAEDLSNYASGNYYESGKKDPFAESAETIKEHTTTTASSGTPTKTQTSNPVVSSDDKQEEVKKDAVKINPAGSSKTNEVKNTVKITDVEKTSKDKVESSSSKGTFFEDKYSK